MTHYSQYPMMRPYVGRHFGQGGVPSLLLVGESHYLPEGATQHLTPEVWYAGDSSTLTPDEIGWISTETVFNEGRDEGFSNRAHSIWRNSLREINDHGPRYADYTRVADYIAFYNFFLRPGIKGQSPIIAPRDVELANAAFAVHFETIKPSVVVFLSGLAHGHFHPPATCSVPVVRTPHPGCKWWNTPTRKYGNRRGRDILGEFVCSLNWPQGIAPT